MTVVFLAAPFGALAAPATIPTMSLQASIDEKNAEIQTLQAQVSQYQDQVDQIAGQADTLQGALKIMGKSQQQLQKNIKLTSTRAQQTALTIQQNQQQIGTLGQGIQESTTAIGEMIRSLNEGDGRSFLELFASDQTVSGFMRDVDDIITVQTNLRDSVHTMQISRSNLEQAQQSLASKQKQLVALKGQLSDQKSIVDTQAVAQQVLLAQTKNQESTYQKMLDAGKQQIAQLSAELYTYESSLKFTLDTTTLPSQGALKWPLADVLITQKFGKTVDSKRLYAVGTHSGVDFRAATGTPVYAVADGTVEGTGNTDLTCPRASFGKWVFIVHNNGLATAYGHLSLIKATKDETVKAGDLIGYSGATGHVTGPHLHVTVFAANGVNGEEGARVAQMPSAACKGKTYTMPVGPISSYLDPLLYFPHATPSMFKDGSGEDSSE